MNLTDETKRGTGSVESEKCRIRSLYKEMRKTVNKAAYEESSVRLCERIVQSEPFREARSVMMYLAMPQEANVDAAIRVALEEGKEVYVPLCMDRTTMKAVRLDSLERTVTGAYGIRTPEPDAPSVEASELDVVFVPGLAFDRAGGRMGMGAGYYDRFLAAVPVAKRIGIAFSFQVSSVPLPTGPYDLPMGALVTEEKEELFCKARPS